MLKSPGPSTSPEYEFPAAESEQMQGIMDVINAVRNLRAHYERRAVAPRST